MPEPISGLPSSVKNIKTIKELEEDHIIEVLRKYDGKVSGPVGAADLSG
jgi:hypothetical protein